MSENFQYDGTFSNNILVVGQTGCGKSFVQSFGKSVDWVFKINLTKGREGEIREFFNYTTTEFHCPDDFTILTLISFLKHFKKIRLMMKGNKRQ